MATENGVGEQPEIQPADFALFAPCWMAGGNGSPLGDCADVDWDCDGATFRSQWQAIRGNGKRAKVVPTETTHTLNSGRPYTIAVRVVDVFGNDAAGTVEVAP